MSSILLWGKNVDNLGDTPGEYVTYPKISTLTTFDFFCLEGPPCGDYHLAVWVWSDRRVCDVGRERWLSFATVQHPDGNNSPPSPIRSRIPSVQVELQGPGGRGGSQRQPRQLRHSRRRHLAGHWTHWREKVRNVFFSFLHQVLSIGFNNILLAI